MSWAIGSPLVSNAAILESNRLQTSNRLRRALAGALIDCGLRAIVVMS